MLEVTPNYKSSLWVKDNYTNKSPVINEEIIEWDMKEAGYNLCIKYGLLPDRVINRLSFLNKRNRDIEIGILQIDDKIFAKNLSNSFKMMRRKFFIENQLTDKDIVSIKKDAIFIKNRKDIISEFDNILFVPKHSYTSFHKLGNVEFYYDAKQDIMDIKNISDENLKNHQDYILKTLKNIFSALESDKYAFIEGMKEFILLYTSRKLPAPFYRTLNGDNMYIFDNDAGYVINDNLTIGLNSLPIEDAKYLDISYNYITYILPIIQRYYHEDL